jgi:hypothetical protein
MKDKGSVSYHNLCVHGDSNHGHLGGEAFGLNQRLRKKWISELTVREWRSPDPGWHQ